MADVTDILTKLLERTNQDKVSWQSTVDESTFLAVVGNTSVAINEEYGDYGHLQYVLKILNQEGREIERLGSNTPNKYGETSYAELSELYMMARRLALGVDSQLDKLLQELEVDT